MKIICAYNNLDQDIDPLAVLPHDAFPNDELVVLHYYEELSEYMWDEKSHGFDVVLSDLFLPSTAVPEHVYPVSAIAGGTFKHGFIRGFGIFVPEDYEGEELRAMRVQRQDYQVVLYSTDALYNGRRDWERLFEQVKDEVDALVVE